MGFPKRRIFRRGPPIAALIRAAYTALRRPRHLERLHGLFAGVSLAAVVVVFASTATSTRTWTVLRRCGCSPSLPSPAPSLASSGSASPSPWRRAPPPRAAKRTARREQRLRVFEVLPRSPPSRNICATPARRATSASGLRSLRPRRAPRRVQRRSKSSSARRFSAPRVCRRLRRRDRVAARDVDPVDPPPRGDFFDDDFFFDTVVTPILSILFGVDRLRSRRRGRRVERGAGAFASVCWSMTTPIPPPSPRGDPPRRSPARPRTVPSPRPRRFRAFSYAGSSASCVPRTRAMEDEAPSNRRDVSNPKAPRTPRD